MAAAYVVVAIGGLVLVVISSSSISRVIWLFFAVIFGYLGVTLWSTVRWRERDSA
jgi:hypothetical protein